MQELLSTATIGRTHGVEGFLKIYSLSGEYAHLKKLKSAVAVFPDGKEKLLSVSQVRFQGDLLLMKFSGYETPESARLLSGAILKVKREDARKLRKGEYYIADLYGLSVVFNGEKVGTVKDVSVFSTTSSHASPADFSFICSDASLNICPIFPFTLLPISLNVSGTDSYVNFIFVRNILSAFFISFSSDTLFEYFFAIILPP